MTLAEQMQVFSIIPDELHDILFDFYALARKTRDLSTPRWEKEYGYLVRPLRTGPEASAFEADPVGILIQASRSVRNFADRLFKNLYVLRLKRDDPLTVEEFHELIQYVYYEDAEKLPLTRKMARVFQGLVASDPFISRKDLANRLRMTENAIKWHIAEMKRRFLFYRLIELDYYKIGLSRLYLFLKWFHDPLETLDESNISYIPCRYPLSAEVFPTGIAKQYVSYQIHTPPWNRRYEFLAECKQQVKHAGVEFLTPDEDLFLATGRQVYYNLKAFDFKTKQWMINIRDLRFLINNSLMTGSLGVYPPYDIRFTVDRRRDKQPVIEFDEIDLNIRKLFWALVGLTKRFVSINMVAKEIGIPYKDVAQRLERLQHENALSFYYWSTLGLSTAFTTLLITQDEFILNNFLSLLTQLPVSSVTRLESLRDRHTKGVHCLTYLPSDLALGSLIQSTFLAEEGVLGFCAQAFPTAAISQPLEDFYDSERKWWKWDQIATPSTGLQAIEDPWDTSL